MYKVVSTISTMAIISIFTSNLPINAQTFERPLHDHVWRLQRPICTFMSGGNPTITFADSTYLFDVTGSSFFNPETGVTFTSNGSSIISSSAQTVIPNGDSLSFLEGQTGFYPGGIIGPDLAIFLPQFEEVNYPSLFHISLRLGQIDTLDLFDHYDYLMTSQVRSEGIPFVAIVEDKNTIVYADTLDQGIAAIRHGNGRDWWINLNSRKRNEQHLLLYSPEGVQHFNSPRFQPDSIYIGLGHSAFSPNGNYFAKVKFRYSLDTYRPSTTMIYEFNRCTGELKKLKYITNDFSYFLPTHGIAFSPNSRFLYVGLATFLIQYDLEAEDIEGSGVLVWEQNEVEAMTGATMWVLRLAPDGKIYIGTQGGPGGMHIIHNPNLKGEACNFEFLGLDLGNIGVRAVPNSPLYGAGPLDNSPCDTLNINHPAPRAQFEFIARDGTYQVEFYNGSSLFVEDHSWEFGDEQTSAAVHPIHVYDSPGTYWVCLEVSSPGGSDMVCDSIDIGITSQVDPSPIATTNFSISPNPTSGELGLSMSRLVEGDLNVYDLNGALVYTEPTSLGPGRRNLQLPAIPNAIYVVQFISDQGGIWTERLILNGN